MPPNPPSNAHGFAMRSMPLRDMQIPKSEKKFLAPPLPNPRDAPAEYGDSQHDLRHNNICLLTIRCEYEKMNAKYQMHYRLRELAYPSRPPLYPLMGIHYLNLLLDFPNTSSLNLFYLIYFTLILMTATLFNIHDREVISNM